MKKRIYIFSPSASEFSGHPIFAQQIIKYISKEYKVFIYTLSNDELNKKLIDMGANLILSTEFLPGDMGKDKFLRFGMLSKFIYGVKRISYSYHLLSDYYKKAPKDVIFHLLEFEYIACWAFFRINTHKLRKTILGFHATDFEWINNRSIQINIYKKTLSYFLPYLIKNAAAVTVNGETLRIKLADNLRVNQWLNKIYFTGWGCNVNFRDINKKEARNKLGIPENRLIGLFFGDLRENKGITELIDSFTKISEETTLLIAGSIWDVPLDTIRKKIDRVADKIIARIEYIDEKEISLYYSASDFVFITHKKGFFSFSGILSLSVEYRRPVIAADVGEIGFFVKKFNLGQTFPPNDWESFVYVTNKFIGDLKSGNKIQYGFKEAIEYGSWKAVSNRTMNIYRQLEI